MKHIKKMLDLFSVAQEEEKLDMSSGHRELEVDVLQWSDELSTENRKTLNFQKEHHIILEKKQGKHFDALEKQTAFSSFFKLRNIVLKQSPQSSSFTHYRLKVIRTIKNLSPLGFSLFLWGCFVAVIFLGYLDKLFIENRVNAGYQKLLDIREGNISLEEVQKKVNNARFDLMLADTFFLPFALFPGNQINSVQHIISWGKYLSVWLDDTLALQSQVQSFVQEKSVKNVYFTQLFMNISDEIEDIKTSLETSLYHYKSITWLPNSTLELKRQGNIVKIEKLLAYLDALSNNNEGFLELLWHNERKRYLVVFQNADEIRPTGGFMGSMWLLEVFRWQIQLFQKKDVYAIEWDLKKSEYERLPAPKWINELTDTFWLRDANYYANIKDSSDAIKFFTDKAGIQIDGIIYINQNILLRLLEITGPVYFPELQKDISSQNFSEIMSLVVEAKSFKEGTLGTPKQVLFDFMEIFFQKLSQEGRYFDYLQSLVKDVESRDIMVWSFHEAEARFLKDMWLDGDIDYEQTLDQVFPVYTSLSGNKSDRYMTRKYRQSVKKADNCSYNVKFEIQSTHDMGKKRRDTIQSLIWEYDLTTKNLLEIQGAATNRQFVRVILPEDAIITPAKGMEEVVYGSRKGVEFFLDTQLQETSFYTLEYLLKNPNCEPYSFMMYKQAGIPEYDIILDIEDETFSYPWQTQDFYFKKR